MSLSACLIVRDEERFLDRCLASLRGHVDEICVLDTGSSDRTVEIARSHGAIVGSRPWDDDFSAARNASLDLASGDWILQIDADEELVSPAAGAWSILRDPSSFCALVELDLRGDEGRSERTWQPRLFRRDPRLRYRRPLHETILDGLAEAGLPPPRPSSLLMIHHGYLGEVVASRGKIERNLRILRAWRDRGAADAYDLFKLASALETLSDTDAGEELSAAWRGCLSAGSRSPRSLRDEWPWWPRAVVGTLRHFLSQGAVSEALAAARILDGLPATTADCRAASAEALLSSGRPKEALGRLAPDDPVPRLRGLCLEALGDLDAAWSQWSRTSGQEALKARMLARLGRTEEAIHLLSVLFAAPAGDPEAFGDAIDALLELGESATAAHLLERPPMGSRRHQARFGRLRARAEGRCPLPPTDAIEAAEAVVRGILGSRPPASLDAGFETDFVRDRVADRLEAMLRRGEESLVRDFASRAREWDEVLPGVSSLVEDTP